MNKGSLPVGKTAFDKWQPVIINGPCKALILSDIHIPYHDRGALYRALEYGKNEKANLIILNGDALDFFSLSFFEKDPRQRDFKYELKTARKLFRLIRDEFPDAEIVYKEGNHEERYVRYLRVKAPELLDIADFELKKVLHLDEYGIKLIDNKRPIRLGELNIIHGHEYRFAISNPVNPARGLFLKAKAFATCGHFHQTSHHTDKTVEQKIIATWSSGCLCDLHPEYMPLNNWAHGFQFVVVDKNGRFDMHNRIIRRNRIY